MGEDPEKLPATYAALLNNTIAGLPGDVTSAIGHEHIKGAAKACAYALQKYCKTTVEFAPRNGRSTLTGYDLVDQVLGNLLRDSWKEIYKA